MLFEGAIPNGAPERGSVVGLGRHQVEDGSGRFVPILASEDRRVQQLTRSHAIPFDLRRRGPSEGRAGQVDRPSFGRSRSRYFNLWSRRRKENGQVERFGVKDSAGAAFLDSALELAVVAVVGGVRDPEIVSAGVWMVIHPEIVKKKCFVIS